MACTSGGVFYLLLECTRSSQQPSLPWRTFPVAAQMGPTGNLHRLGPRGLRAGLGQAGQNPEGSPCPGSSLTSLSVRTGTGGCCFSVVNAGVAPPRMRRKRTSRGAQGAPQSPRPIGGGTGSAQLGVWREQQGRPEASAHPQLTGTPVAASPLNPLGPPNAHP